MNRAYISAFAALAGSIIGGLTSLATSWLAQRTQVSAEELIRNRRRREELYGRFIDEASRLYIDALGRDEAQASEQARELVKIYSVVSQMRFLSSRRVIQAADNIVRKIVDTYAAPKKTFPELREMLHEDAIDPLREFSEACRASSKPLVQHLTDLYDRHGTSPDRPRTRQRLCAQWSHIGIIVVIDRGWHRARHRLREVHGFVGWRRPSFQSPPTAMDPFDAQERTEAFWHQWRDRCPDITVRGIM